MIDTPLTTTPSVADRDPQPEKMPQLLADLAVVARREEYRPIKSRRSWWIAAITLLLFVSVFNWRLASNRIVNRAGSIQIGHTMSQVEQVMGRARFRFRGRDGRWAFLYGMTFTPGRDLLRFLDRCSGSRWNLSKGGTADDDYDVCISFDEWGEVIRIKRGDEIVTSRKQPR